MTDFEAINGPLTEVDVPDYQVERLQSAVEGELDGLCISYEVATSILRYVLAPYVEPDEEIRRQMTDDYGCGPGGVRA